ncbi:MAG TPA: Rieske 2Fe-2S domain-containing protein [Bacteroidia bacterium]|nr:Rieske 2Fe-2S domain-containing protein [Bacteroidia bacterium]
MTRKEFIEQVGGGAAGVFFVACAASCKKKSTTSSSPQGPSNVNFTIDISSGPLSSNGGYMIQSGVIVGRTTSGSFVAIAAACTHQGANLQYSASGNKFTCPNHGAQFDTSGNVLQGPATVAEKKYNTSLNGNILTVTGG